MQIAWSAFSKEADLDVLNHPILNAIYYTVSYASICNVSQLSLQIFGSKGTSGMGGNHKSVLRLFSTLAGEA